MGRVGRFESGFVVMLTTAFGIDQVPFHASPLHDNALFETAFDAAVIGMALIDADGRLLKVNPSLAAMLGYEAAELERLDFHSITHADDLPEDIARFESLLRGDVDRYRLEKRYLRRDGSIVHVMSTLCAVPQPEEQARLFVCQAEDIGARKTAERAIREEAERLALTLEILGGGPWQYDVAGARLHMSPAFARFLCEDGQAIDFEEFRGRVHPDDRANLDRADLIEGRTERCVVSFRVRASCGTYRWLRSTCKLLRDADGRPEAIIGVAVDVTEERRQQARFQAEAETDPLTGLLNRRGLERQMALEPARCRGVAVIDLDHFKEINDKLGHAAGDVVLREAARRIGLAVRRGDAVVRLGGDEFAVLLTDEAPCECEALAGRLLAALEGDYGASAEIVSISASIGVALRHDGEMLDDLLARADEALYRAKRAGRAVWRIAA